MHMGYSEGLLLRTRLGLLACALLASQWLCGCAHQIRAADLNKSIGYLPWGSTASKPAGDGITFVVRKGMRLTFASTPLDSQSKNVLTPPASVLQWEVPDKERLTPLDFFHLSWMAAVSIPTDGNKPPVDPFKSPANAPSDKKAGSPPEFMRSFYGTILESLTIDFNHVDTSPPPKYGEHSAQEMHDALCSASGDDFNIGVSGGDLHKPALSLVFKLPVDNSGGTVNVRVGGWGGWYLEHTSIDLGPKPLLNNLFYDQGKTLDKGLLRSLVWPEVPVRIGEALQATWVAPCMTAGELQERLGVTVTAVLRDREFTGHADDGKAGGERPHPALISLEPTLRSFWAALSGKEVFDASKDSKCDVLLASGDRIFVSHRHRRLAQCSNSAR